MIEIRRYILELLFVRIFRIEPTWKYSLAERPLSYPFQKISQFSLTYLQYFVFYINASRR